MVSTVEKQLDLFISEDDISKREIMAAIQLAKQERSEYVAELFSALTSHIGKALTFVFIKPIKAFDRHIRLRDELLNLDDRLLSDIGLSRWETPMAVKGQIDRSPSKKANKSTILPLFSLLHTEAQRKERYNSDHPMAA
ncbi:MAG: DUF1127 domain-containing protein [Rhodospirillales bacterium]|nr:DUF1127 domain-containing protein [Rhodospirillales bacterium]